MSASIGSKNRYRSQVWIVPEDKADRSIAIGFINHPAVQARNCVVEEVAGGWTRLRDGFAGKGGYNEILRGEHAQAILLLLVDCDGFGAKRLDDVLSAVDQDIKDRVFALGCGSNPEAFRTAVGRKFEAIGRELAEECKSGTQSLWSHPMLAHNQSELARMTPIIKPILFV